MRTQRGSLATTLVAVTTFALLLSPSRATAGPNGCGVPNCSGGMCATTYDIGIPNGVGIGFRVIARRARCRLPVIHFSVTSTLGTDSACGFLPAVARAAYNAQYSSAADALATQLGLSPECQAEIFIDDTLCSGTPVTVCTTNGADSLPVELLGFSVR